MKSTFPRNLQFKETTTGQQGHEETRQHSEVSVTEEEEASADRGTDENQVLSEAGLTVRVETEYSTSGTFPEEESTDDLGNGRRDIDYTVPKVQGNPQNASLLPSFFVAPICTDISGPPQYKLIPFKREVAIPVAVTPKKESRSEGVEVNTTLENPNRMPEGTPKFPARPKYGTQKPRNTKSRANAACRGPRTQRPCTEPPPGLRTQRPSTEPSPVKSAEHLVVENAGGRGEVKEKLVYVVEEKGKSVSQVETDLFTLNEILTIKKDLLELSEFAKKLKQLKERNKPQESAKAEDDACRCEPTANILKDVNKRIEALEMRQEELEKGSKSKQKEELAVKVKTPSSTLQEPAKPTVNVLVPPQPKANAAVTRRGFPGLSNAQDLVNELMDIKEQLKRLEQRRGPKPDLQEMPVEKVKPKKKDRAITVFSSKTYIFSPDKLENKRTERRGAENKALGDKFGFEETKIINWLKGVCSGGSDFKVLLKPSPTIMEESQAEGKLDFMCKNCSGPLDEMGALANQEPQKNRATHKDLRQDEFLKKESSSRKVFKKRSYKECFVSPSGRFFAWMKRSSDKVMRNFCSDWPQPKVLEKLQSKQISRTTSTGSIGSIDKESPPRGVRCSGLSDISLPGNLQDFVRVVCKSEKTAMNENVRCLGKKGRRSLSKDKLQKEDKNEAVRRREPRRPRLKKSSELSISSSSSEVMNTMDFDVTSNSREGSRWQKSTEFHAQVFSCFTQPDYLLDASRRRTECLRETDRQRRKREKKEKKAVKRLQKKTAKMQKLCEKRRRKLAKKEEKYASRCIIEGCDFGKDYRRKHSPVQSAHQPQEAAEASKQTQGHPYRSSAYKKQEYPPIKQAYVSDRRSEHDYFEDKKLGQERDTEENSYMTGSSGESLTGPRKHQPEKTKSVLSAERASFEKNTLRDFFKSFGWMDQRLGEICEEYAERKKAEHEEAATKDARKKRREKDEFQEDRFWEDKELYHSSRSSASERDYPQRTPPHNHDPDHVENCDCVRLFLQNQVEKKLAALRNAQIISTESMATVTDFEQPKHQERPPKAESHAKKEHVKYEAHSSKAKHHKSKDFEYRKYEEEVPKPEHNDGIDSRTHQQPPTVPEPHDKVHLKAKKRKEEAHPKKSKRKVRHQEGDSECLCELCVRVPCHFEEKHDIGAKGEESSESIQLRGRRTPGGASSPRRKQSKAASRQPQENENSSFLSYLCQLWRSKNCQPNAPPAEGRASPGRQDSKTYDSNSPEPEPGRGKFKLVCSRCEMRQRNFKNRLWRMNMVRSPPDVCVYREGRFRTKRNKPMPRRSDHPPSHAHCFFINDNCDNLTGGPNLLCFPHSTHPDRRCRVGTRPQEEDRAEGRHHRRDQAIECRFIRDCQDVTDKTTETEEARSTSGEKINRKNLKDRLASLHCLWKNLQRCTLQKAFGGEVGRCIRRSLSGLDNYDCWGSDARYKSRRQTHCGRMQDRCRNVRGYGERR